MRRWALLFGSFLVFLGVISLVEVIWKIDLGKFIWPLILISIGILILVRPPMPKWWHWDSRDVSETNRTGAWYARDETINGFIGDTVLDFSQTILPEGETHYKLNGFIGDIKVRTIDSVGVKVRAQCFIGNVMILGEESTGIMAPSEGQTPGYEAAPKKVTVDINYFIADVNVKMV